MCVCVCGVYGLYVLLSANSIVYYVVSQYLMSDTVMMLVAGSGSATYFHGVKWALHIS